MMTLLHLLKKINKICLNMVDVQMVDVEQPTRTDQLKPSRNKLNEDKRSGSIYPRSIAGDSKPQLYKPSSTKSGTSKSKVSKPTRLEVPHMRRMKKQVSFDYRSPVNGDLAEECPSISKEGLSFIQNMNDSNLPEKQLIRSYQRDLVEFYKGQKDPDTSVRGRGSILDVPILATLEVIPPKPGNSRLSRKDKQTGWSLPDPSRSSSRTARAVERFLVNLTRPTDQRNQPIPKKPPKMSDPVPSSGGGGGNASNKGKMKIGMKMKSGKQCCKSGYCTKCYNQVDAQRAKSGRM